MSRASLGRVFPKLFGRTYAKYLAEAARGEGLHAAQRHDKSVAEIAIETGFGSVSNFNRRFLALKRTSPLRYRKTGQGRMRESDRPRRPGGEPCFDKWRMLGSVG